MSLEISRDPSRAIAHSPDDLIRFVRWMESARLCTDAFYMRHIDRKSDCDHKKFREHYGKRLRTLGLYHQPMTDSGTFEIDGDSIVYVSWNDGKINRITFTCPTEERLHELVAEVDVAFPVHKTADDKISVQFIYSIPNGTAKVDREISAPNWPDIRSNYSKSAVTHLDKLFNLTASDVEAAGKIAIIHGVPGTGKTFILRALVREWRKWASCTYVTDLDTFFGNAGYMMQVLLEEGESYYDPYEDDFITKEDQRYKIILCEDAEEYILNDGKSRVGQAVSKLLNVGDGMIGQGLKVMFLFTTNRPLNDLHPAVTRPGRCFAKIEVPELTPQECSKWLGHEISHSASLADLYGIRNSTKIATEESGVAEGMYL